MEASKEQRDWQAVKKNKAILDWVTIVDYSTQQSGFIRRRQVDTEQRFRLLNSIQYQQ
jgi:hypothetical protein